RWSTPTTARRASSCTARRRAPPIAPASAGCTSRSRTPATRRSRSSSPKDERRAERGSRGLEASAASRLAEPSEARREGTTMRVLLVTAEEMRALDREVIDRRGVPGVALMETAGRGVAQVIAELVDASAARVAVFAGPGNNGGDGFVAARHLAGR